MINIHELKKKIIYRSSYRGTKEMDNLLGSFTKKYIDILEEKAKVKVIARAKTNIDKISSFDLSSIKSSFLINKANINYFLKCQI